MHQSFKFYQDVCQSKHQSLLTVHHICYIPTYCCTGSNPVVINYAPKPVSVNTVRNLCSLSTLCSLGYICIYC